MFRLAWDWISVKIIISAVEAFAPALPTEGGGGYGSTGGGVGFSPCGKMESGFAEKKIVIFVSILIIFSIRIGF